MTWPPDGMRRVRRHDPARHQPVERHPDTGQMLLDSGSRPLALQQFDICGHMHRLDPREFADPLSFGPVQEGASGPRIGRPRVFVADVDGEEFEEAPRDRLPAPSIIAGSVGPVSKSASARFVLTAVTSSGPLRPDGRCGAAGIVESRGR